MRKSFVFPISRNVVLERSRETRYNRCSLELFDRKYGRSLAGNFMHTPSRKHACVLSGTAYRMHRCTHAILSRGIFMNVAFLVSSLTHSKRGRHGLLTAGNSNKINQTVAQGSQTELRVGRGGGRVGVRGAPLTDRAR